MAHTPGHWIYKEGSAVVTAISDVDPYSTPIARYVDPWNGPLIAAAPETAAELVTVRHTLAAMIRAALIVEADRDRLKLLFDTLTEVDKQLAMELDRLKEVNAALVEELKRIQSRCNEIDYPNNIVESIRDWSKDGRK